MKAHIIFCGSFLLSVVSSPSLAISNIENDRPTLPNDGFSGSVSLGFEGKSGNQEEAAYSGAGKLYYRQQQEIVMLMLEQEYGSKNHIKNNDNSFAHLRWTHLLNDAWATEMFAQWEQDEFSYLASRTLTGGGGRYIVAQQQNRYTFALGFGAFTEREVSDLVTYEDVQRLWRVNSYYSYKLNINNNLSFINTTYIQPNTENFDDYRILFDVGFSNKITENLALSINYRLKHDSQPTQNLAIDPPLINQETNSEYKTSLLYRF